MARGRRIIKAELEALSHLTATRAARRLGCTVSGVVRAAKRYGITMAQPKYAQISHELLSTWTHLTVAQVAARLEVSHKTIYNYAHRHNLQFARARAPSLTRGDIAPLTHLSCAEAARKMGRHPEAVRRAALKFNLRFANQQTPWAKVAQSDQSVAGGASPVSRSKARRLAVPRGDDVRPVAGRVPPAPAAAPPVPIGGWDEMHDQAMIASNGRYVEIAALAERWGRSIAACQARYHRVRVMA